MKFQVFENGQVAEDFNISGAYMFGADSIPLRDSVKIKYKNGIIECKKGTTESAGLALLWPVQGFGTIMLQTTRLPERKRPYILNVELARAKLMQIVLKREDWAFFGDTNHIDCTVEQGQLLFIEALQNMAQPEKASSLADQSLTRALICSEELTDKHSRMFLDARCSNRSLTRHSLGCEIDLQSMKNPEYQKKLTEIFGFVTIPVVWADIEKQKGQYDFSVLDQCIDVIANKRLAICAGPLLCFDPEYLPKWLLDSKLGFEKIREAAFEFVSRVVVRYMRYIHAWRIISGMNSHNHFDFNFEQIIEMTRAACLAAKATNNKSRKMIEIRLPWGEHYAEGAQTIPPLVYADMIMQTGIAFDAFALQLNFGIDKSGMHIRDMMQISAKLDSFAPISKPLHITAVTIPGVSILGKDNQQVAGLWHKPWDQATQAKWLNEIYKVTLAKPFISSVTYSRLADSSNMAIPQSGLLTEKLEPKKALMAIVKMQKFILGK